MLTGTGNTLTAQVAVKLTMSVEEARQVVWAGTRGTPKEPMGKLLDEKRIDTTDLAWAVECAYSSRVRAAARTLLAHWLGEPQTLRATVHHGPQLRQGSRYLHEQEQKNLEQGDDIVTTLVIFIFLFPLVAFVQDIIGFKLTLLNTALLLALLSPMLWFEWRKGKKHYRAAKTYRAGREGEDKVVNRMLAVLDGDWTIYRNLQLPGWRADLDVVLVGPGGVWVVEVKSYGVPVRTRAGIWEKQGRRGWFRLNPPPTLQARENAVRLCNFLKSADIVTFVSPAAVLVETHVVEDLAPAATAEVWLANNLDAQLARLKVQHKLAPEAVARVVRALDGSFARGDVAPAAAREN